MYTFWADSMQASRVFASPNDSENGYSPAVSINACRNCKTAFIDASFLIERVQYEMGGVENPAVNATQTIENVQ